MKKFPKKIYIVGAIGSGKTHLAKILSKALKLPHYDLDDIYFIRKHDLRREENKAIRLINKRVKQKQWIIEGVFARNTENIFKNSDLTIILNFSRFILLKRVIIRWIKKWLSGREKSFMSLFTLIRYAYIYKYDNYLVHKQHIKNHKVICEHINNKKELNNFLKKFLGEKVK